MSVERRIRLARLAGLVALLACGCASSLPLDVHQTRDVLRLFADDSTPPARDRPGWERVSLPEGWGADVRRRALAGWFRTAIVLDEPPAELWAVYLPRVSVTTSVWVNGALVGGSASAPTEPLPRDWIRPHLVTVPAGLWRTGANDVAIRLQTHLGAPGFLRAIVVGPERLLRPIHDRALWWRVGLTQIVSATTLASGLLLLALSLGRDELRSWNWLGVGLVAWAWSSADAFFRFPLITTRVWEWTTAVAPLWAVVCFGVGFHRILGLQERRRDAILLGLGVTTSLALLALPPLHAFTGTLIAGMLAIVVAGYLALLFAGIRRPGQDHIQRWFLVPAAAGVALGLHDVVYVTTGRHVADTLVSPYIPGVALLTTGWVLLARLVDSHREALALNRDLERRVAEKHRELEANYARVGELERHRAVANERERLMRDVHDGVGGQLVSTLALVESGEVSSNAVAEEIRGALEDLRLVIDSLDPEEDDLLTVLGTLRSRLEPRLARHGLRFSWHVVDVPPVEGFGPAMALQAMRIVQEAVANVVKHAGASTVTVRTGESPGPDARPGVFVEVGDDGGGIVTKAPRGRGLINMAQRAARLGGTVTIHSAGTGTTVRLWLPACASDGLATRPATRRS